MAETQAATPEPSFREQVAAAEAPPVETAAPETEPAAQDAQAEGAETGSDEPQAQEKVEKVVPLAALHEERRKRQELQRQHEEGQRNFLALQRQQAEMLAHIQAQQRQAAQPAPIDPQTDPLGAQYQATQRTQAEVAELRNMLAQNQAAQQQDAAINHVRTSVNSMEEQFRQERPDYQKAVEYLRATKYKEYVAAGFDATAAQEAVTRDAWGLADACLRRGFNPAERAYEIAQALGYKPQADAVARVAMQQAGQKASLPSGGGGQSGGKLSLDALAKMSPSDFLKATSGDKWKKLMQNA